MSIKGFDKARFKEQLNQYLFASGPIRDFSHLVGRDSEMSLIDEALSAEGRHVFIYGDRGVGKTSLAAAAANQYQSSDNTHIQIGCGPDTKFYKTIADLVDRVIKQSSGKRDYEVASTFSVKFYKVQWKNKSIGLTIPEIDSMFTAVEAIEEVSKYHSDTPIIVIDEFDQIECENERKLFSNYLKDLGDRGVNIKLIFTGVAQSLTKLLGDHESSFRQLHTIELERLFWGPREEIVKEAVSSFGIEIDPNVVHSIAKISNGFPYYAHLLTEKLLWVSFDSDVEIEYIDKDIFSAALEKAISSISAHLRMPYDSATLHRNSDYREILWATADSESTIRYIDGMFKSYLRINRQLYGPTPKEECRPLSRKKFVTRLANLKKKEYGGILENPIDRKGVYSYRENILRGYVAMRALELGVELQGDVPDEPKKPTAFGRDKRQFSAGKDYTPHVKYRDEDEYR